MLPGQHGAISLHLPDELGWPTPSWVFDDELHAPVVLLTSPPVVLVESPPVVLVESEPVVVAMSEPGVSQGVVMIRSKRMGHGVTVAVKTKPATVGSDSSRDKYKPVGPSSIVGPSK